MVKYREIERAVISDSRNIIISDCSSGGYTIAQQFVAKEGKKEIPIFMKGAFHIDDVDGLINLRDSLNRVIDEYVSDTVDWD